MIACNLWQLQLCIETANAIVTLSHAQQWQLARIKGQMNLDRGDLPLFGNLNEHHDDEAMGKKVKGS